MFSRMLQWSAALVFGAMLAGGQASASPISPSLVTITPLAAGGVYEYSTSGGIYGLAPGTSSGVSGDVFRFSASAAILGVLNTTIAFGLPDSSGFKKFELHWYNEADLSTSLASASFVPGGATIGLGLPVAAAGIYRLVIDWATKDSPSLGGSYQTAISVPGERQNDLPLPPALLLFGSALVGLGVLGRRKRKGAAA